MKMQPKRQALRALNPQSAAVISITVAAIISSLWHCGCIRTQNKTVRTSRTSPPPLPDVSCQAPQHHTACTLSDSITPLPSHMAVRAPQAYTCQNNTDSNIPLCLVPSHMAARVHQVGRVQQLAALVALDPPRVFIAAAGRRAGALHKAVRQEAGAAGAVGLRVAGG